MIRADALSKAYGGTPVLRGVTFSVEAGESLALTGPSGCGKTTLLRLVAGLEAPDSGALFLGGQLASGPGLLLAPHRRGLSMAFQRPALWPHMTVLEQVTFPLAALGAAQASQRAGELLEALGVASLARRHPQGLSGGEARRVSLARALAPRAALLLLDEPFAHLDATWRERAEALVAKELSSGGTTLLLAAHAAGDARGLCRRVLQLEDGALVAEGQP